MFNTILILLLVIVAASLACIAVALWGIMFTIKQTFALLENVVKMIARAAGKWGL